MRLNSLNRLGRKCPHHMQLRPWVLHAPRVRMTVVNTNSLKKLINFLFLWMFDGMLFPPSWAPLGLLWSHSAAPVGQNHKNKKKCGSLCNYRHPGPRRVQNPWSELHAMRAFPAQSSSNAPNASNASNGREFQEAHLSLSKCGFERFSSGKQGHKTS